MTGELQHGGGRCRELAIQMSEYLDGELSVARAEQLERHLADCDCCGEFVEGLRRAIATCRQAGCAELPRAVQARARRRVGELLDMKGEGQRRAILASRRTRRCGRR